MNGPDGVFPTEGNNISHDSYAKNTRKKGWWTPMARTTLTVKGMHCNGCEALLKDVLEEEGAMRVEADYKTGKISFEHETMGKERAKTLIEGEGYEAG